MTLEARKVAFIKLGSFLGNFTSENPSFEELSENEKSIYQKLSEKVDNSIHYNGWFIKENIHFSLQQWSEALTEENLNNWLSDYKIKEEETPAKTVAIIMAGNIPLVGFHDFLSVLISGNRVLVKPSSNDNQLLPVLVDYLILVEETFKDYIEFTQDRLHDFDAVIATGSNNTARYFEYYFSKKPHIIRKNRNSVAILTGDEPEEELKKLGEDIFRYYGLGCRNVSKLYVPEDYPFDKFFKAIFDWNPIINQNKYSNNYDYNKAVYLMSDFKLLDNGFLILKEDKSFSSPIASLFYETYSSREQLYQKLEEEKENIQCVVSNRLLPDHINFGETQKPYLNDYADNVDTLDFLLKL